MWDTYSYSWLKISIHALREESDQRAGAACMAALICIHALREESDIHGRKHNYKMGTNFYPRSP